MRNQHVVVQTSLNGIVCRIAIVSLEEQVFGFRFRPHQFGQGKERNSPLFHTQLTPRCDVMEIADVGKLRQTYKTRPTQIHRILHLAVNM